MRLFLQSDLIKTVGWDNNVLEVEYRADSKVFCYFGVPQSTFRALARSKHLDRSGFIFGANTNTNKFNVVGSPNVCGEPAMLIGSDTRRGDVCQPYFF